MRLVLLGERLATSFIMSVTSGHAHGIQSPHSLTAAAWIGGVAFIDTDNDFVVVSADEGPFSFSNGNSDTGFVVGGGVDYKIAPQSGRALL